MLVWAVAAPTATMASTPMRNAESQGDELVHDVGAVFCDAPDVVEGDLEG